MRDTADEMKRHGEQLLNKSKTRPLRKRMEAFVN